MNRKILHIITFAFLMLNITGVAALSRAEGCGMECCQPAGPVDTGYFEAPSCCGMDGAACGFESGQQFEDLFAEALCSRTNGNPAYSGAGHPSLAFWFSEPERQRPRLPACSIQGSSQKIPLYLSNAAHLC